MIELTIHGLGSSGDGVARLEDGRAIFVPGAIPGDRVRVRLGEVRKKVQYGELVELLQASDDRVSSRCEVEGCGGCALEVVSIQAQAELKRRRVVDTLRRIGKLDVDEMLSTPAQAGDGWHYRHRVRLHAAWIDDGWRLGYFARRSHRLVPLAGCPVLWPELETAAEKVARSIEHLPRQARLDTLELVTSRRDGRTAARLHGDGVMGAFRDSMTWVERSGLSGIEVEVPGQRFRHGNLELRYDHGRADEYDLRFEPGVFTQANPPVNDLLVAAVTLAVRPQQEPRLLELHAGVGNFSLPLSRAGAQVTAVEQNRRAATLCSRNAHAKGQGIDVRGISDTDALNLIPDSDLVLIDPPRTGARSVATSLAEVGPARVVYVSCDSATLARDLAILCAGGYTLTTLEAFDMFPQTPHVETLAVLDRA